MYVWLNKKHVGGGCGPTLACDVSAQPGGCGLPGNCPEWPPGAPLALPGRTHLERRPPGGYWVPRVAGTKVSSRPGPTGSCFKYGSGLLGKTEVRSDQDEGRTSLEKGSGQQKLEPRAEPTGDAGPHEGGPGGGTRLFPSQAHITSVISGERCCPESVPVAPVRPTMSAGDLVLAQDLSLLALCPLSPSPPEGSLPGLSSTCKGRSVLELPLNTRKFLPLVRLNCFPPHRRAPHLPPPMSFSSQQAHQQLVSVY